MLSDYDNWRATAVQFTLTLEEAVKLAEEFIDDARVYVRNKGRGWS
jgi:hypothetical protein